MRSSDGVPGAPAVGLLLQEDLRAQLFSAEALDGLAQRADLWHAGTFEEISPALLARTSVLVTGWGSDRIDLTALRRLPSLTTIVHTGGSVRKVVSPAVWDRGLAVSSQADTNAAVVAEYTLAMVLLSLKEVPSAMRAYRDRRTRLDVYAELRHGGVQDRTVGLLGASRVGRHTAALLRPFPLRLLLTDPYVSTETARQLGCELVGLDALAQRSDVLSVHVPELPSTRGLVDARLLSLMPDGATLINTARGAVVDTRALVAEVSSGRLRAVLDVTDPDVPPVSSPLWDSPQVWMTPHLAGAYGTDLLRLGDGAAEEVKRVLAGLVPRHAIDPETQSVMA